ncbi:hypothetical protein MHZ92_14530 [Sporosarcina sp. ACRSL]|uniref:hypothetical protein n=1 Tax=Sporosarcina sp. ACRSL TaxID=2918215 RepID=UPI001EF73512|nr:hypothetical protein [Sporosarcina sp. ACRSL]MCG7345352.1 hypothetical protein [Sporosarcina sp. ACRSL]
MKRYEVEPHAIDRAIERFGQPAHNAKNHLIQLMQTAVFNGVTGGTGKHKTCRVFDHYASRTRLIVAKNSDTIVTVYSMDSVKGGAHAQEIATTGILSDAIMTTIRRELRKAHATFRRSYRQYNLRLADLNVEIAELFRNKVRCKHPGTQAIIQAQIDVLEDEARAIKNAMQTQEQEYRAVEGEAKAFLGEEVSETVAI